MAPAARLCAVRVAAGGATDLVASLPVCEERAEIHILSRAVYDLVKGMDRGELPVIFFWGASPEPLLEDHKLPGFVRSLHDLAAERAAAAAERWKRAQGSASRRDALKAAWAQAERALLALPRDERSPRWALALSVTRDVLLLRRPQGGLHAPSPGSHDAALWRAFFTTYARLEHRCGAGCGAACQRLARDDDGEEQINIICLRLPVTALRAAVGGSTRKPGRRAKLQSELQASRGGDRGDAERRERRSAQERERQVLGRLAEFLLPADQGRCRLAWIGRPMEWGPLLEIALDAHPGQVAHVDEDEDEDVDVDAPRSPSEIVRNVCCGSEQRRAGSSRLAECAACGMCWAQESAEALSALQRAQEALGGGERGDLDDLNEGDCESKSAAWPETKA